MDWMRLGIAFLFVLGVLIPWAQFYSSGLGTTFTINLNLLDVSISSSGALSGVDEKHSYMEFVVEYGSKKVTSPVLAVILSVARYASAILVLSMVAGVLFIIANFDYNRKLLLSGGILGLIAVIMFMFALYGGVRSFGYTPLDLFAGVVVKEPALFGKNIYTLRIWVGWYLALIASILAIYKGKKLKRGKIYYKTW